MSILMTRGDARVVPEERAGSEAALKRGLARVPGATTES